VLPAGIPRDERVVAVLCDLSDLTVRGEISRFLVVVAPRAADPVRLLDGEGAVLSEHALADGIAVIRSPGTVAEVAVSTAGGVTSTGTPLVDSGLVGWAPDPTPSRTPGAGRPVGRGRRPEGTAACRSVGESARAVGLPPLPKRVGVRTCRGGLMGAEENESFTHFVSVEQAGLLRLAVLLAGDRGQAEDLVQTALMKSYRHWGRITRSGTPSAYVRRVLVTTHTSWRRRLSSTEQVMAVLPDPADPHGELEAEDEDLRRALRALPPRMRASVVLRFYEDLSEQRTAELMGCSASTVNTQTARGLERLRTALAAHTTTNATVREEGL
jgi:RNA polymerase sigma-70 factor (sigma-E family)